MRQIVLIGLLFWGFTAYSSKWIPSYCRMSPSKYTPPKNVFDCMEQLDSILKPEIIKYFREQAESIASIEISNEIGDFFIGYWNLDFDLNPAKNQGFQVKSRSDDLLMTFREKGIEFPDLIINTIFSCYYKKLNSITFDIDNEIQLVKHRFNLDISKSIHAKYYETRLAIKRHEDSLITIHRVKNLEVGDTIGSYYKEKQRNAEFYLTATINQIDYENQKISINVIDIVSNLRYRNIITDNSSINVGDIIVDKFEHWYKLGEKYFDFYNCSEELRIASWQNYVKLKFSK
jgi:hypothetical protein